MPQQVITLCTVSNGIFNDVNIEDVKSFQADLLAYFENEHKDLVDEIASTGELSDDLKSRIIEAAEKYRSSHV